MVQTGQPRFEKQALQFPHSLSHMTAHGDSDCLYDAGKTTLTAGALGLVISAMQNTVQKHNEGAKGVFTRTGGTIALFGMH